MDVETDSDPESEIEMLPYNPESQEDSLNPFDYQDPLLTSPLSRAVISANIEEVQNLIKIGKDINNADNKGNLPLHLAVLANSKEIVILLLPVSNINHQNYEGFTPLLLSLHHNKSEEITVALIDAGANIFISNNMKETVLHFSVRSSSINITEALIKHGADINAVDLNSYTPLIQSAVSNNLNAVCLLLYYNADVNVRCLHKLTAFMYALHNFNGHEIANVLIDYHDDFSLTTCDGFTPLVLAANIKNPLAIELVKRGADVNFCTYDGYNPLYLSLFYKDPTLFKEVWSRIDCTKVRDYSLRFIHGFLNNRTFSRDSWVECLYLILNSDLIKDIIRRPLLVLQRHGKSMLTLHHIFRGFYQKGVELQDRITIMYIILSMGYNVSINDITLIYYLYGYNEEIQILIHHYYDWDNNGFVLFYHPIPTFIFHLERDHSVQFIYKLFENQIQAMTFFLNMDSGELMILKSFRYFSIPFAERRQLLDQTLFTRDVLNEILSLPDVPSLVEICRNTFRLYLRKTFDIRKPYQFHNVVKRLNISEVIKDILVFKKPIY